MTQRTCSRSPIRHQYPASTEASRAAGLMAALACSTAARASAPRKSVPSNQKSNVSCTVTGKALVGSSRSCNRGPSGTGGPAWTVDPGSASNAARNARPASALGSALASVVCMASRSGRRPGRVRARPSATASPRARFDPGVYSARRTGAVAAETISRRAIQSPSPGSPARGRVTNSRAPSRRRFPWHALYRLPEPHGHGCRGPTTGTSTAARDGRRAED